MTKAEAPADRQRELARERQKRLRRRQRGNAIHCALDLPEPVWFALYQRGVADPDALDEKATLAAAILRVLEDWHREKK